MKQFHDFRSFLRRAVPQGIVLCALVSLLPSATMAKPVTYTAFTITDGQLGTWAFHNARVYLTLKSDTSFVQFIQPQIVPNDPTQGTIDAWINSAGTASVTIMSSGKTVSATFAPNQVFVAVDLGDTANAPHSGARGLGFSSYTATGIEPSYPLGIEDGTLDWGDIFPPGVASTEVTTIPTDLVHNAGFSGRAWPCSAFPNPCASPAPLKTDKGDFYLYLPYSLGTPPQENFGNDSLSAAFFTVTLGSTEGESMAPPLAGRQTPNVLSSSTSTSAKPITYHGYVIADVTLGKHHYTNAQVYLSFDADASTAVPFTNGLNGFVNATGRAHVTVVSGGRSVSANFARGQLYVYYDLAHASVGFGSTASGRGYPLSITKNDDNFFNGLVQYSSVGAVSDLTLVSADAALYSPATATLATDLTNATTLSGGASSCVAFNPTTSVCSNLTPVALKTNRGNFYLYEPYTEDETLSGGTGPYSINWGVFWSEMGSKDD
jgi:hypothetical protein